MKNVIGVAIVGLFNISCMVGVLISKSKQESIILMQVAGNFILLGGMLLSLVI